MRDCPNVLPGAGCVDPSCIYCRIAAEEEPRRRSADAAEEKSPEEARAEVGNQ